MNSNKCSIRPFGQRSISSTFLFRASNRASDCGEKQRIEAPSRKKSNFSLSDFLNRKLHRSSVLPSSAPRKGQPFSSPVSGKDSDKDGQSENREGQKDAKFSIDSALHMFKNVEMDKNNSSNCNRANETNIIGEDELQKTRKRKNLFEGDEKKTPSRKRLVVLGEASKPAQGARRMNVVNKEPTRPFFNHYENGGGWWDDNMEGVDNEEVGCNELWEGVGCTTLGGIEWH